jgi:hypothetical protein
MRAVATHETAVAAIAAQETAVATIAAQETAVAARETAIIGIGFR